MTKAPKTFSSKLKNFFKGKKNAKKSAFLPNYANYSNNFVHLEGKPVWGERNYDRFSEEGYIKNVIANRSVAMIANGAASVPWVLKRKINGEAVKVEKHPILDILNRPNPSASGSEFLENLYSYRLISGNAYIQAVKDASGRLQELFLLRPDRVAVIAGKGGIPQGYRYSLGQKYKDFPVDRLTGKSDILHIKKFHPLSDWYGLSAIEAAAYSIDQHNEASTWNQSLLQNGARPSGALIVRSGTNNDGEYLSEEQYLRIKSQLDEFNTGASNAGKPILLEGGLEWREMSISPKDMDFINTKNSAARDIALAFGVPPQLLGIVGDSTYNNMAEARLSLWEQTILPMVENMASNLNNWLIPMFDENLEISPNIDTISALAPRRQITWDRVKGAEFLSNEEKKELVGL